MLICKIVPGRGGVVKLHKLMVFAADRLEDSFPTEAYPKNVVFVSEWVNSGEDVGTGVEIAVTVGLCVGLAV